MRYPVLSFIGLCSAALAGCGDTINPEEHTPAAVTITGYFTGVMTETANNQSISAPAVAMGSIESGRFQVATVAGYRQFDVTIEDFGGDSAFGGIARGYIATSANNGVNAFVRNVVATGSYVANVGITGTFELPNNATDTFDVDYQGAIYTTQTSLAALAGNWVEQQTQGYTLAITIDANGHVTGGDNRGCVYSADLAHPDTTRNFFSIGETLLCSVSTSTAGFAVLRPGNGVAADQLVVLVASETAAATRTFTRSGS